MAQLSGRNSLRDMVENLSAQAHRLYHLGSAKLSRSNLSRINEDKPYTLYEALFGKLLARCQGMTPGHTIVSIIRYILWMRLPLTCAYLFFHGLTSVQPRGLSSSMSG